MTRTMKVAKVRSVSKAIFKFENLESLNKNPSLDFSCETSNRCASSSERVLKVPTKGKKGDDSEALFGHIFRCFFGSNFATFVSEIVIFT